ncbi:MAG TPA: response regulator transcription factor [Leptolyngbyaceae cyanobacterium]
MIRLLLVDDQPLFRQGLASLLALEDDLEIVGQASQGQEAIQMAEQLQPEVILMDVRMPICDGVQATQEILQRFPWMRILVLTTFDEDDYIWRSLQVGALGYLLKSTPAEQLANAIRMLAQGHSQLGPTIAPKVFSHLSPPPKAPDNQAYRFSQREMQVLVLLSQGHSNREIAQKLYLTEGTIKNHVTRILNELNLRDRTQAALWAKQHLRDSS